MLHACTLSFLCGLIKLQHSHLLAFHEQNQIPPISSKAESSQRKPIAADQSTSHVGSSWLWGRWWQRVNFLKKNGEAMAEKKTGMSGGSKSSEGCYMNMASPLHFIFCAALVTAGTLWQLSIFGAQDYESKHHWTHWGLLLSKSERN